jgi:hypothetical protein
LEQRKRTAAINGTAGVEMSGWSPEAPIVNEDDGYSDKERSVVVLA